MKFLVCIIVSEILSFQMYSRDDKCGFSLLGNGNILQNLGNSRDKPVEGSLGGKYQSGAFSGQMLFSFISTVPDVLEDTSKSKGDPTVFSNYIRSNTGRGANLSLEYLFTEPDSLQGCKPSAIFSGFSEFDVSLNYRWKNIIRRNMVRVDTVVNSAYNVFIYCGVTLHCGNYLNRSKKDSIDRYEFSVSFGPSARFLAGEVGEKSYVRKSVLGTAKNNFFGADAIFRFRVNSINCFLKIPLVLNVEDTSPIYGVNAFFFGVSLDSSFKF